MTVQAARALQDGEVCLVGVGPPNAAANLARRLHAPHCVLVYESGAIGAKPVNLPLSIGDDDLAATADELVSVPEMFSYWIGAGRMDVGFLGAAQIDRRGNINTTVIGPYAHPKVRLPGAGGAPEIAAAVRKVIVMLRHSPRAFVGRLDFVTSLGRGGGAFTVITDLGVLEPGEDGELELTALHSGIEVGQVLEATGWPLRVREPLPVTEPPTERELEELRALTRRS
jgi:glutaconate CoA-transferase subunit B